MSPEPKNDSEQSSRSVSRSELNAWRRGFTPQAEIWNGRMAILGIVFLCAFLFGTNYFFSS